MKRSSRPGNNGASNRTNGFTNTSMTDAFTLGDTDPATLHALLAQQRQIEQLLQQQQQLSQQNQNSFPIQGTNPDLATSVPSIGSIPSIPSIPSLHQLPFQLSQHLIAAPLHVPAQPTQPKQEQFQEKQQDSTAAGSNPHHRPQQAAPATSATLINFLARRGPHLQQSSTSTTPKPAQQLPARQGTSRQQPTPSTTPTSSALTSMTHMNPKKLFVLVRILLAYLEKSDPELHAKAENIIKECKRKRKEGHIAYGSLSQAIGTRLRLAVGDEHWRKVCEIHKRLEKGHSKLQKSRKEGKKDGEKKISWKI